jgi:hypothetical protein
MPGQEAVDKLEALGLKVRVLPKGVKLTGKRVQSATPTYQTKVKRGSLVTITVG